MFTRSSLLFPIYLLPSSPFRHRKESTESANPTDSTSSTDSTKEPAGLHLSNHRSYLRCAKCATDICLTSQIISKGFTGRHGRAYLVSPSHLPSGPSQSSKASKSISLPNTRTEYPSSRQLVTGAHTVSDVRCAFCSSLLGWKYDEAEEESQRYKVGKYILETKMICSSSSWEDKDSDMLPINLQASNTSDASGEGAIEFDSQDDDECEDLFAGVWSPSLAAKRRQSKSFRSTLAARPAEPTSRR